MSEARMPVIAANWKMHKTIGEAEDFVGALGRALGSGGDGLEIWICPPSTALAATAAACRGTVFSVAAQNMHGEDEGAFTGEISARMALDAGARGVVLGHSERRALFGETDEALAGKVTAAVAAGLTPILCVGETEAERDAGETEAVLERQVTADLAGIDGPLPADLLVAYEPVWAIGTGRTASPGQADSAISRIRQLIADRDAEASGRIRILYGGSVKPANAEELLGMPQIDGALVGGASLDPGDFAAIAAAAPR